MPRTLAFKTLDLIAAARDILEAIQPATVRGVCYQLFTRKLIPDMSRNKTQRVSRALTNAREQGNIPWSWIVDETRGIEKKPAWNNPAEFVDTVANPYHLELWNDRAERMMVISEKGTVGGLLRPVIKEYGVPFQVFHGFGSATALNDLAERCACCTSATTIRLGVTCPMLTFPIGLFVTVGSATGRERSSALRSPPPKSRSAAYRPFLPVTRKPMSAIPGSRRFTATPAASWTR